MPQEDDEPVATADLLRTIASDIHFWIPFLVLLAGLMLLRELH
jgi:hypothetical protein